MKMCLRVGKKLHRKSCTLSSFNKTLPLRTKVRKTSRRKRKRRRCENGYSYTNIVNMAKTDTTLHNASANATGKNTIASTATGSTTAAAVVCITRTPLLCKQNVNCKRKQQFWQRKLLNVNNKIYKISINDNNQNYNNNNNKCYTMSNGEGYRGTGMASLLLPLTSGTQDTTKSLAFLPEKLGPPRGTTCVTGNANSETVQLNLKQSKQRSQHQPRCPLDIPWKYEEITAARKQQTQLVLTAGAVATACRHLSSEIMAGAKPEHVAAPLTSTSPAPCSRCAARLPHSPSNTQSTSSIWWPTSASSACWPQQPQLRRPSSTASSYPYPALRNTLFRGILMTLLVLSICHNNVLQTSAASVITSEGSISSMAEQRKLLSPPLATITTTTPEIRTTKGKTYSFMSTEDQQHKQPNLPHQQHQHRLPAPTVPPQMPLNLWQTQQNNTHRPDMKEDKMDEQLTGTSNHPTNTGQLFVPPKAKRQQRGHQQLPQYLTSTQGTSFGQNGMTPETTHKNTFQSTSVVGGRLTVPMDAPQQQLQHQLQQQHFNRTNSGVSTGGFSMDANDMMPFSNRNSMPVFDFGMAQNITARTGHMEAVLKCRVDRIGDKSVSWIRKRDLHILTVGKTTYTSDNRFLVTESKDSREWILHVKSPQARDSGIYECQVNTEPKMSMAFQLNIIEISPDAQTVITGPTDLYVKAGSVITLTCLVSQPSIKDIGPIHWYRSEYLLTPFGVKDDQTQRNYFVTPAALTSRSASYDHTPDTDMYDNNLDDEEHLSQSAKDEITLDFRQRVAMEQKLCDTIKSKLRISNAQISDSGNYTCQPTTSSSASVLVHVINDENPAAMQKGGTAGARNL